MTYNNVIVSAIGSCIGAFVGFIFALFLQIVTDKISHQKKKNHAKLSIATELKDIKKPLFSKQRQHICIPNWEALKYSGEFLELIDLGSDYESIIEIYSAVEVSNTLYLHNKEDDIADEKIKKVRVAYNNLKNNKFL